MKHGGTVRSSAARPGERAAVDGAGRTSTGANGQGSPAVKEAVAPVPFGRRSIDLVARDRPAAARAATLTEISILNESGIAHDAMVPDLPPAEFLRIHRAMVLTRAFDGRMLNMQRQGQMGTFAPGYGQEATQIGQVWPLRAGDWFSPSYRSFGAQIVRGWTMDHLMLLWAGFHEGFAPPPGVNDLPFSIVIGSHLPLATGVAMGLTIQGRRDAVLVNFGDGASSEGAVHEAMNFAAVFTAPVVFVLENNGYAISTTLEHQTGQDILAARGPACGMPGVRVDGNDVFAVMTACREALERARAGGGPTLVETVTYRMGVHTTADDPKVYRDDAEVEAWRARCPIARFEKWLAGRGLIDEAGVRAVVEACELEVMEARDRFRERAVAHPEELFDFVYESLPEELREQREEYLARLRAKGVIDPAT